MEPPTQKPVAASFPATYGVLLGNARTAATEALASNPTPSFDIGDFARLLSVAGQHLDLLLRVSSRRPMPTDAPIRSLAAQLAAELGWRGADHHWGRAADQLGAAHDLLSTHVGPDGVVRTPQGRFLTRPAVLRAALIRVVDVISEPIRASGEERMTGHLDEIRSAVGGTAPHGHPLDRLDLLTAARTNLERDPEHRSPMSGLEAFSLLHQLASSQAEARSSANAHTLRDLCVLGSATCLSAGRLLPPGETPLGSLDRAATLDHLERPSTTWRSLGGRLYPRIQGLTKAPGTYHSAVAALIEECRESRSMNRAVLGSLPGLAVQAAATVTVLSSRHALVTCGTAPVRAGPQWLPLDAIETTRLAEEFLAAGRATHRAKTALARQLKRPTQDTAAPPIAVTRARSRSLGSRP